MEHKCERCGSTYAESYFKDEYTGEVICEECLLKLDMITTSTETYYYLDGEYIGSDANYSDLIENICDNTGYKEIKEDKQ